MNHKTIRFGIIGTGAIAKVHADCIAIIEDAELIAISSSSAARAQQAEALFSVKAYANYKDLIQRTDVDVVIICTQSGAHLEVAIEAAKAGKHVLSEKPLEVTLERADRMIATCKDNNVKLGCVFQNRYSPDFIKAKEAVDKGLLGKLLMGNASINWYRTPEYYSESIWRGSIKGDGGAALINQGIHTIDLLLNIMGEADSVFAKIATNTHDIEGEDTASALISFKTGALGTLTAGTSLYPGYPERLEIYGDKGSIILEAGKIIAWNIVGKQDDIVQTKTEGASGSSDPMAIGNTLHKLQIEDMISAIKNDTSPPIDGEEGRKALELIMSIYESNRIGKEVKI